MRCSFFMLGGVAAWSLIGSVAVAAPMPDGAQAEVSEELLQHPQTTIYRDFLRATSDLWFLLSGIRDEADADAAATRFSELVRRICLLDEQLSRISTESGLPAEVEAEVHEDARTAAVADLLEAMQMRILEAFDDINAEFLSLCRVHCYGSEPLAHAFTEAAATGMFAEDSLALLRRECAPLSEMESEEELVRLHRLVEPDRDVLATLQQVTDAASAEKATAALSRISKRLHLLVPQKPLTRRAFAESYKAHVKAAFEPLSPLLWGIRTELVRIAALPGYESADYDAFSDALNSVYADLDAAHSAYFEDVFDSSFRADLDDALQENARSSE